jgi:hypothetical protein
MRSAVDMASRRADQLEPVICLFRTCAIPTYQIPVLLPRALCSVETGKTLEPDCSWVATGRPQGGPKRSGRWATVAGFAPGADEGGADAANILALSSWTSLCEQLSMDRPSSISTP